MKRITIYLLASACTMQLLAQGTFQIPAGTTIQPTGGVYLVFNDMGLLNNGMLQQGPGDGAIKFTGSVEESISGSGTTTIDSLVLAKGSGVNINLLTNIDVVSEVNFTSGLLNFGNSIIDLGATGAFKNESETSRAYSAGTGYIQSSQILNAPSSVNAGDLGAIITSSANLGNTTVRRGFTSDGSIPGGKSILRYYIITSANNAALNATFRFEYLDAELNNLAESSLSFWKSPDNVNWTDSGFTTRDTIVNYVQKTGIMDFSSWTLAPQFSALPITLGTFSAFKNGSDIEVTWQVLTSLNVDRYVIERSAGGANFTTIGVLPSAGAGKYIFMDHQPFTGYNFYRLRIVDTDGSIKFSSIVKVNVNSLAGQLNFFPNPVADHVVTLQLTDFVKGSYQLHLFNNAGQQVYSFVISHPGGSSTQTIHLPQRLTRGIYRVHLKSNEVQFNSPLFIK